MRRLTEDERKRAGQIAEARMASLGLTTSDLAKRSHVDERTVRRLIAGTHWPSTRVQNSLCDALGWPPGELWRQAVDGHAAMAVYTDRDLLHELVVRARRRRSPNLATYERLLEHARSQDPTNGNQPSRSANSGQS